MHFLALTSLKLAYFWIFCNILWYLIHLKSFLTFWWHLAHIVAFFQIFGFVSYLFLNHCAETKYSKKCGHYQDPAYFFKVYFQKKFRALSQKLQKWELRTRACDINFFCKIIFSKNYCAETKYRKKCDLHHAPAHFSKFI